MLANRYAETACMKQIYFVALAGALVLNAAANLMMKFGMVRFKPPADGGLGNLVSALASNWILLLGLCFFAVNVVLYTIALKGVPISVAYPIMTTVGFAIIVVVAGIYLRERLSPVQWVGVGLILVGVWLVASRAGQQLPGGQGRTAEVHKEAPG
jgi:multidrug transporter EmrE-like cation transporter